MAIKKILQKLSFRADPERVYAAYMDSKEHAAFTGEEAKISLKVGGSFKVYAGYIEGRNLELKKGHLIVQKWRSSEWPKGFYSTVRLELKKKGKGTELHFSHEGVPDWDLEEKRQGWIDYYWTPMKAMLDAE